MIGSPFLTFLSLLFTAGVAIFGVIKDWEAHKSHARRYSVLVLIVLIVVVGSANLYITRRDALKREDEATAERIKSSEQIGRLEQSVEAERSSHERDTKQFLAALDRVYVRLSELKTDQHTVQLRQEILHLQEKLKTSDAVAAQVVRAHSAKLGFGFYTPDMNATPASTIQGRLVDGYVPVDVSPYNHSEVSAVNGQIIFRICKGCKFAEEPKGSLRIEGAMDEERVFQFEVISTQGRLEPIRMKVIPTDLSRPFGLAFRYGCQTCSENDWQILTVNLSK